MSNTNESKLSSISYTNSNLPEQVVDRIEKDAKFNADIFGEGIDGYDNAIEDYRRGATSEATRAMKLVKCLQEVSDSLHPSSGIIGGVALLVNAHIERTIKLYFEERL